MSGHSHTHGPNCAHSHAHGGGDANAASSGNNNDAPPLESAFTSPGLNPALIHFPFDSVLAHMFQQDRLKEKWYYSSAIETHPDDDLFNTDGAGEEANVRVKKEELFAPLTLEQHSLLQKHTPPGYTESESVWRKGNSAEIRLRLTTIVAEEEEFDQPTMWIEGDGEVNGDGKKIMLALTLPSTYTTNPAIIQHTLLQSTSLFQSARILLHLAQRVRCNSRGDAARTDVQGLAHAAKVRGCEASLLLHSVAKQMKAPPEILQLVEVRLFLREFGPEQSVVKLLDHLVKLAKSETNEQRKSITTFYEKKSRAEYYQHQLLFKDALRVYQELIPLSKTMPTVQVIDPYILASFPIQYLHCLKESERDPISGRYLTLSSLEAAAKEGQTYLGLTRGMFERLGQILTMSQTIPPSHPAYQQIMSQASAAKQMQQKFRGVAFDLEAGVRRAWRDLLYQSDVEGERVIRELKVQEKVAEERRRESVRYDVGVEYDCEVTVRKDGDKEKIVHFSTIPIEKLFLPLSSADTELLKQHKIPESFFTYLTSFTSTFASDLREIVDASRSGVDKTQFLLGTSEGQVQVFVQAARVVFDSAVALLSEGSGKKENVKRLSTLAHTFLDTALVLETLKSTLPSGTSSAKDTTSRLPSQSVLDIHAMRGGVKEVEKIEKEVLAAAGGASSSSSSSILSNSSLNSIYRSHAIALQKQKKYEDAAGVWNKLLECIKSQETHNVDGDEKTKRKEEKPYVSSTNSAYIQSQIVLQLCHCRVKGEMMKLQQHGGEAASSASSSSASSESPSASILTTLTTQLQLLDTEFTKSTAELPSHISSITTESATARRPKTPAQITFLQDEMKKRYEEWKREVDQVKYDLELVKIQAENL